MEISWKLYTFVSKTFRTHKLKEAVRKSAFKKVQYALMILKMMIRTFGEEGNSGPERIFPLTLREPQHSEEQQERAFIQDMNQAM